ncbi:MAG: hypothetical protein JNL82_12115 [Myxococcales bacterium]|nr:hypothetical protein [Myxococcales bacterium]
MTSRDDQRDELAPFAHEAADDLDTRGAAVRPDFAAMLARARAIAAEEGAPPPTPAPPPLADEGDADGDAAEDLAPFTAALRAELDARLHERSLAGIPPLPGSASRGRRIGVVVGLLAAAAAAVALFLGDAGQVAQVDRGGRGVEASSDRPDATPGGAAHNVAPAREAPRPRQDSPVPGDSFEAGEPAPGGPDVQKPVPGDSREPDPAPRPRRPEVRKPRPAPAPPSLEEEAQALWQRGELAAAEAKYREILRLADGRRAELAYGDLFALTRQMLGNDGQARVWREYLDRFPRGRFAEDARAGLCQRAAADARMTCWQDYLAHHPDGAHRAEAEAAGGSP